MTTLLITRPLPEGRDFLAAIEERAGPVPALLSPLIEIAPQDWHPRRAYAGAVITSANALPSLARLPGLPVFAVGPRTAALARAAGHPVTEGGGDVESLIARIVAIRPDHPLIHLRGEISRGDLANRLSAAGIETEDAVVYRQVARPLTAEAGRLLAGSMPVLAPVFSPRTATLLAQAGPVAAPLDLIAMSDAVAEALRPLPARSLTIAARPDGAAMLAACLERLRPNGP